MELKVEALREGSVLVTPEERLEVQGAYDLKLGLWRRRRKIYQELWGMITEAVTENLKDLKVLSRIAFKFSELLHHFWQNYWAYHAHLLSKRNSSIFEAINPVGRSRLEVKLISTHTQVCNIQVLFSQQF